MPAVGLGRVLLAVAIVGGALSGCKNEAPSTATSTAAPATPAQPTAPPAASAVAEARQLFATTCAVCHGESGRGDGPAAAALNPKPRDYSDKAWQASVTDDDLRNIILQGGAAVGKSPTMPGQPQLKSKPGVVDELVIIIRSFGQ